ncbi:MAG: PEGA domain-containing protein [Sandaracinaceae bacterium]|nr:PEGA domain-containing protein [Sandaracinaceae bacterium]
MFSSVRTVLVISDPPGADVTVDGLAVGRTPLTVTVEGHASEAFLLRLGGYHGRWEPIPDQDGEVRVTLIPAPPPPPPPPPPEEVRPGTNCVVPCPPRPAARRMIGPSIRWDSGEPGDFGI